MTATIMSLKTTAIRWMEVIEYPQAGVKSKILLEDGNCRYALMSLAVGMHIAEHASLPDKIVTTAKAQLIS